MTVLNKDKILDTIKDFITQGKFDKATREYEKLLALDPQDMRIKLRIAELYAKCRQIPEAIKAYREVAEHYAADGFYLKAVTVYKNILRLNPSLMDINNALADLYEKMGLNKDAVHQFEILAQTYDQKGLFQDSLKIRQKLVELAPHDAGHRVRLAEAYQREDKKEEAIEQYEVLAKQFAEQKKEASRLIELYERILPYRPQNKEMLADLVKIYYDKKDFKMALKWLEQSKQHVASDPFLLALQAEMYGSLNQLETARSKYQELAELYQANNETEKALEAYEQILILLPEEIENMRPMIEAVEEGSFERLLKNANEKRQKKVEAVQREEEAKEKEKEEKEKERELQKAGKGQAKAQAKPQSAQAKPTTTAEKKAEAKPIAEPVVDSKELAQWLKTVSSSLALVKMYKATGLDSEAKQEENAAREALKKILAVDKNHAEALTLLTELDNLSSKK